ncbi:MFS transporter [Thermocatellispora tengchongensis]
MVLSAAGMTGVVYYVIAGPHQGWAATGPLAALAVGVLTLVAFAVWELRTAHPMLPLRLFRDRNFSGASFSIVLLSFGSGALLLMLTQYLQFVLDYSVMAAGLALLPYAVAATLFNAVGAGLGQKVSNRALIGGGLLVMGAGFALLSFVGPEDGYGTMIAGLLVMGVGGGLAGPAAYTTLLGAVPPQHAGVGSALNDTVQQVGVALSVAVLGSVLAGFYTASMPESAPAAARESIAWADQFQDPGLIRTADEAFVSAMSLGSWVGAAACVCATLLALAVIRRPAAPRSRWRRTRRASDPRRAQVAPGPLGAAGDRDRRPRCGLPGHGWGRVPVTWSRAVCSCRLRMPMRPSRPARPSRPQRPALPPPSLSFCCGAGVTWLCATGAAGVSAETAAAGASVRKNASPRPVSILRMWIPPFRRPRGPGGPWTDRLSRPRDRSPRVPQSGAISIFPARAPYTLGYAHQTPSSPAEISSLCLYIRSYSGFPGRIGYSL